MAYKIIFTEAGQKTYDECIEYVIFELQSPQAAKSLLVDIDEALGILQTSAKSFNLCEDQELADLGLRKMHLLRHNYKIFYSIDEDIVHIEYILHDKRDFKNVIK